MRATSSNKPQEGKDYQINKNLTDWIKQESDAGTYYYKNPLRATRRPTC